MVALLYLLLFCLITVTHGVNVLQAKRIENTVSESFDAYSIIANNSETVYNNSNSFLANISNFLNASDFRPDEDNLTLSTNISISKETERRKRAVAYSPFSLDQLFPRQPSPLDISSSQQNGLDTLIKRGLNAINDLSIFTSMKNETDKEKTRSNNVIDSDSLTDSDSIANVLKSQIQSIQFRLNSLATEMSRFIQTLTQSTTRLFIPQQQNVFKSVTKNNNYDKNINSKNIFSRWLFR